MDDGLAARIASFLDAHHVMSLATIGQDGPHAANLFYVRDGLALIWVSDPTSRHSIHIEARPDVAATVAPDFRDFQEIQGVQISGRARRMDDEPERASARERLQLRYPFLQTASDSGLRHAYNQARFYRLEPARVVLIDNRRGFGSKEVLDLDRCG